MPEIAEVTRVCHYLRTHLVNRRIANVLVTEDDIIYGKKGGTTATEFKKTLTGRTVLDAKQQGKYFWLVMDKQPHPLLHLGMTGWMKLSNVETGYYKPEKRTEKKGKMQTKLTDSKSKKEEDTPAAVYNNAGSTHEGEQEWPPKYYKFVLQMEGEPKIEAAFVDARRLGRIGLVDAAADEMRNESPLKENGPDPVQDPEILTPEWLTEKLQSKKVPIKAALIDQAVISGVGNWVADEILHHACVHPEQYSNTLSDEQCKQLHESMNLVCKTACDLLGDSDQYPEDWIFKYRWSKGKKEGNVLPSGEKIQFVTAGGRTSAFVASRQKKTGPVAGDVDENADSAEGGAEESKPKSKSKAKSKKAKAKASTPDEESEDEAPPPISSRKRKANAVNGTDAATSAKPEKKVKAETDGAVASKSKRRSTRQK